jgi:putative ABC transport system permease protein
MRVNFFAILPKTLLEQAPQTWITAYRQASESPIDLDLVKSYPNLTVVDVEASLKQAQVILSQLSMAIQLLFGFTVLAGMFVLATALASTQNERMRESAILKTMGADQDFLSRAWRVELLFIGALSGFLGGLIASISGWIIAKYVLEIEMAFPIMVIAVGAILGAALSWLSGYWLRSKILNVAPIVIMRES